MSNYNNLLKVKLLHPFAKVPTYAYESAGYDLYCLDYIIMKGVKEYKVELPRDIWPGEILKIPLGIATEITPTHVGIVKDRSSLAAQGLIIMGGVIDSDYRGEWIVLIRKVDGKNHKERLVKITPGMKIAQVLFIKVEKPMIEVVDNLGASLRGEKGFGSSDQEKKKD